MPTLATTPLGRALAAAGVIAVIRADDAAGALAAGRALAAGGITAIELTHTTPGVERALTTLRDELSDRVMIGAGSVRTGEEARRAAAAGASFLVTPGSPDRLLDAVLSTGLPAVAGAFTPTEAMRVRDAGAEVVKLFPAGLGGPAYLRAIRGPLPDLDVVPTGGVSAAVLADWLDAGAIAVGAGSELCSPADIAAGAFEAIERRGRELVAALHAARGAGT